MNKGRILIWLLLLLLASCANRGVGPQGGPRDTIPPAVVKELPLNGSVMYLDKRVEVVFDEYIQLDNVQNNVLISPPQQNPPEIKAIGKKLSVVFQEDLLDSTTYTIDFGPSICDYNEKVPLEGYVFSFATGDCIDSLAISGCVYDASTLNPVPHVLVGIHRNLSDTALNTLPFARITRTNSDGVFTIHNVQPGNYRLYALNDISRDFVYQPGEGLAYFDSIVTPTFEVEVHSDTLWRDTLGIDPVLGDTLFTRLPDSISTHSVTRFYPDSLLLWYFDEAKQRHYFQGVRREEQHAFSLIFSAGQDTLPVVRALRPSEVDSLKTDSLWVDFLDYSMLSVSSKCDTLTYWLTDSLAISMDSIYLELQYKVTDSLYNLVPQIDTLLAVYRHPRLSDKAREAYEKRKRERKLDLRTNSSSSFEIYDTISVYSSFPLSKIDETMFHLYHRVDTLYKVHPFSLVRSDSLSMQLQLVARLQPESVYQLKIDSAACYDIYGACNDSLVQNFKLKSKNEYSSLRVRMVHYDSRARIQLLNEKEEVLREISANPDGVKFDYLAPTVYYLRMYMDYDGNGEWTTGDWLQKRHAEPIYYYPKKLKLRANWDFEELFDHMAIPQVDSKPKSLRGKSSQKK